MASLWIGLQSPALDGDLLTSRPEWKLGVGLANRYHTGAFDALVSGRRLVACFALLGTVAVYLPARAMASPAAGLFAAASWASSPWILGTGSFVQMDVPAATMGAIAFLALMRAVRRSSLGDAAMAGSWLGLAILTKLTWLFGLIAWPILGVVIAIDQQQPPKRTFFLGLLAVGVAWLVVVGGYRFQQFGKRLGQFQFISERLAGPLEQRNAPEPTGKAFGNRFAETFFSDVPVPLPAATARCHSQRC